MESDIGGIIIIYETPPLDNIWLTKPEQNIGMQSNSHCKLDQNNAKCHEIENNLTKSPPVLATTDNKISSHVFDDLYSNGNAVFTLLHHMLKLFLILMIDITP